MLEPTLGVVEVEDVEGWRDGGVENEKTSLSLGGA